MFFVVVFCCSDYNVTVTLYFFRLLEEGICNEKNIPSISSINRIIRDKAILQRRSLDSATSLDNLTLPTYSVSTSDQEEVRVTKFIFLFHISQKVYVFQTSVSYLIQSTCKGKQIG
jgi:hypothetical protein